MRSHPNENKYPAKHGLLFLNAVLGFFWLDIRGNDCPVLQSRGSRENSVHLLQGSVQMEAVSHKYPGPSLCNLKIGVEYTLEGFQK